MTKSRWILTKSSYLFGDLVGFDEGEVFSVWIPLKKLDFSKSVVWRHSFRAPRVVHWEVVRVVKRRVMIAGNSFIVGVPTTFC